MISRMIRIVTLSMLACCSAWAGDATPLGSAFTYQGLFKDGGTSANGTYHLRFQLWNALAGGSQVGSDLDFPTLSINDGLFTVALDFGSNVFDGSARWLQVQVVTNGGATLTPLTPRQPITATPYALQTRGIFVDDAGQVGLGTTTPADVLHVSANDAVLVLQDSTPFSSPTPHISFWDSNSNQMGRVGYDVFGSQALSIANGQFNGKLRFLTQNIERLTITENGAVGIGTTTPLAEFEVSTAFGRYFRYTLGSGVVINRNENGALMNFALNGAFQGSISVSGSTVSYNGFMGSHYAWMDGQAGGHSIERGALVRMTGENRRLNDSAESDVVYGIKPTASPNDPACLGAYLGIMESDKPADLANPHLVAAVGNGEMLVTDSGTGDIQPGDYLISADVVGCAMKDDSRRFPVGHVVARAAQRVDWSDVMPEANGRKVARISVFFESFMRNGDAQQSLRAENAELRAANANLAERLDALDAKVVQLATRKNGDKP